ncbi:MAG: hypothetical protein AAGL49_09100, partial [Pseudomonadota bacterium]
MSGLERLRADLAPGRWIVRAAWSDEARARADACGLERCWAAIRADAAKAAPGRRLGPLSDPISEALRDFGLEAAEQILIDGADAAPLASQAGARRGLTVSV